MEVTVTAKTYDEAITEALIELQTTSEYLDVVVLEEGKEGLLGVLGSKPWVIRAKALSPEELAEKERKKNNPEPEIQDFSNDASDNEAQTEEFSSVPVKEVIAEKIVTETVFVESDNQSSCYEEKTTEVKKDLKQISPEEAQELTDKGLKFLHDLFSVMGMTVEMSTDFDHNENELDIVLSGEDMGVLIGKRGQTLDSIQYLTSLVVNRHHDGYIRVKIDTENYRERRQVKLEELAKNIAHKVTRSKHSVELEPMNPYERRIIHSTLQSDPYVTTKSEGEEPYRHVIVMLKKAPGKRHRK